jgi:hypothetical protein
MPAVVPEFPGITAGGEFAGTAAESSSFRFGYFDKTVNNVEMILDNGDVVQASPVKNADLYFGSAGALGTLGTTGFLKYLHGEFKIYPLWLCPIKHDARPPIHTALTCVEPTDVLVNIGVWGSPNCGADFLRAETFDAFVSNNRAIGNKVVEVRGAQVVVCVQLLRETRVLAGL